MDILGTRLGMALSVGLWTLASALHAVAQNAFQLGVFRFVLGVGEGGCFPGVVKGATDWFPKHQRALAIGIAIGGAAVGAVVAPPLTVWLADLKDLSSNNLSAYVTIVLQHQPLAAVSCSSYFLMAPTGWRVPFLVTGLIGAIWVALWWIFYHAPARSPFLTKEESSLIQQRPEGEGSARDEIESQAPPSSVLTLLSRLDVWGLSLMRFLFDPVFYFYMLWIPKYLAQERELSLAEIGRLTWIPFLALGISNILGGWVSDRLIVAGVSSSKARTLVMAAAALLTISSSTAAFAGSAAAAVAIMSLLMFAHGFWITNYVTVISETFDKNSVATVMGLAGMVGAVGGMLANTTIGWVADRYSFLPIWIASGCLYPLAWVVLLLTVILPKKLM
jgi:ACS family hexuronate transporter-like MFS transporter